MGEVFIDITFPHLWGLFFSMNEKLILMPAMSTVGG
jgi:hypothetical protein